MTNIAASVIGVTGNIYATDERTAITRVFDARGRFLFDCQPDSGDMGGLLYKTALSVGPAGVMSQTNESLGATTYVRFDSNGRRIAATKSSVLGVEYLQPVTGNRLVATHDSVFLLAPHNRISKKVSKLHDGRWVDWPSNVAFAHDGSFALTSGKDQRREVVNFYSPQGASTGMFEVPNFLRSYPSVAYHKNRVVICSEEYLAIFDAKGEIIQVAKDAGFSFCQPHIVADGREILIVPAKGTTLRRYAMP